MTRVYQCDSCLRIHKSTALIFTCLACDKEICESCMHGDAHCTTCAAEIPPLDMKRAFEKEYGAV